MIGLDRKVSHMGTDSRLEIAEDSDGEYTVVLITSSGEKLTVSPSFTQDPMTKALIKEITRLNRVSRENGSAFNDGWMKGQQDLREELDIDVDDEEAWQDFRSYRKWFKEQGGSRGD